LFRLYPSVVDPHWLTAARIEARMRDAEVTKARAEEEVLSPCYWE